MFNFRQAILGTFLMILYDLYLYLPLVFSKIVTRLGLFYMEEERQAISQQRN